MITHIIKDVFSKFFNLMTPQTPETVSQCAERLRVKSTESSSTGGRWKNISYQIEPMDCFNDPNVEETILMWGAQLGKTEIMLNTGLYVAENKPSGVLIGLPTQDDVGLFSRTRLAPMIRDCPALRKKIAVAGNDALQMKFFLGGFFRLAGAGTAREFAAMPLPVALLDEVDKYGVSKDEGDAISLARQRVKMQGDDSYLLITSTPSLAEKSKIAKLYEQSDQRRFWVNCCHCGEEQLLMFKNLHWDSDEKDAKGKKIHKAETAYYVCEHCACEITDAEKNGMVDKGKWKPAARFTGRRGYNINVFYSPFRTFTQTADAFIKAHGDPEKEQVFFNAEMGEVWKEPHEKMDAEVISSGVEEYYCEKDKYRLPQEGSILTASVDVQHNRVEMLVRLWGLGEESWGIEHHVFFGDPTQDVVWNKVDSAVDKIYTHASGAELKIKCCAIDTGYATEHCYTYVDRRRWPVVAIKGDKPLSGPLVKNKVKSDTQRVPLYNITVHLAKNTIFSRSMMKKLSGPGKMHWNQNFNSEYFEQLTAEKRVMKMRAGVESQVWIKLTGRANEALDLEVYAYAALRIGGYPDFEGLAKRLLPEKVEEEKKKEEALKKEPQSRIKKTPWARDI